MRGAHRGQHVAQRVERDAEHVVGVARQRPLPLPGDGVPQRDGAVVAGGGEVDGSAPRPGTPARRAPHRDEGDHRGGGVAGGKLLREPPILSLTIGAGHGLFGGGHSRSVFLTIAAQRCLEAMPEPLFYWRFQKVNERALFLKKMHTANIFPDKNYDEHANT